MAWGPGKILQLLCIDGSPEDKVSFPWLNSCAYNGSADKTTVSTRLCSPSVTQNPTDPFQVLMYLSNRTLCLSLGVMLFDIGQKMGYNGMDNGGMQLHNVRIPRDYLLQKYVTKVTNMNAMEAVSRYVKVDRNGTYTKVGNEKMLYATMTYTR